MLDRSVAAFFSEMRYLRVAGTSVSIVESRMRAQVVGSDQRGGDWQVAGRNLHLEKVLPWSVHGAGRHQLGRPGLHSLVHA
jgi:hypothetical protein